MVVSARIETLRLAETFVISRESQDTAAVVQVEVAHDGLSGFGEGAPIERYGESAESALAYVEEHADALGDDPFCLDEIEARLPRRELAARERAALLCVATAALFPVMLAVALRPAMYNGIRHFVFVTPPLAALGGVAAALAREELGQTEVEDFDDAVLAQHDVLRLDVAVHDAYLVRG
jgi:hypothetical protein